jgi:rhamnosyltransferase
MPGSSVAPSTRPLAVVVTYCPDLERLSAVIDAAATQTDVVVFDNASTDQAAIAELIHAKGDAVTGHRLSPENVGLGEAYNWALGIASDLGHRWLLLLDQDSVCAPDYVDALFEARRARWADVVALGGTVVDERVGAERRGGQVRQGSGTLLDVEAARAVGPFDESLFLHHVDAEWFHRARSLGWRVVATDARLDHQPGSDPRRVPGVGRAVRDRSPGILALQVRNTVVLSRRSYVPRRWLGLQTARLGVRSAWGMRAAPIATAKAVASGVRSGVDGTPATGLLGR